MPLKQTAKFIKTLASLPFWPKLSCAGIAAGRRPDRLEQVASEERQLRARGQRVLQEREEQLSLALRSSNLACWDWNLLTDQIRYTEGWQHLLGLTDAEIPPTPEFLYDRMHPDDVQGFRRFFVSQIESSANWYETEFRLRDEHGQYLFVILRALVLRHESGQAERLIGTIMDITKRRMYEEELLLQQRQLQVANEILDQRMRERTLDLETALQEHESFSYSVSHDLRAPLRHINCYSAILSDEYAEHIPSEAHNYLQRIEVATKKMGQLIDHLLELSRLARTELVRKDVNLSELASSIARRLSEKEPQRRVRFAIEEGLSVSGDPVLLRQMLEHLLENAWKFSSSSSPAQIEFGRTTLEGKFWYFVKDNGVGFDMAYSNKLFNIFERLHVLGNDGTGIGLSIVQRIVQRHGGTIWADATPDAGAVFYFSLS